MGLLSGLFETVLDVALLPVAVAEDLLTMGGVLTDEEAKTPEALEKIADDLI